MGKLSNEENEEYIQSYQIDSSLVEIIQIGVHLNEIQDQSLSISMATYCPILTNTKLDEHITHKADLHRGIIENYDELWLLLVIEDEMLSSDFVDDDDYLDIDTTDVWDQIFLLKLRSKKTIKLK